MDKQELRDYINANLINEKGKFISARCDERWLKKNNMYEYLINFYSDSTSLRETLYRLVRDIDIRPRCKTCGKILDFKGGFPAHCSQRCTNKDPEVLKKNSEAVSKSLKRAYAERGDKIKEKRSKTLESHYGEGSTSPFGVKAIQDKIKSTVLERYGVDNIYQLDKHKIKCHNIQRNRSIEFQKTRGYDIEYVFNLEINDYEIKIKNGCKVHGDIIISRHLFNNRTSDDRKNHLVLCPICNPLRNPETSIETIIKNILIKYDINFVQHDRTILKPLELDFYLPNFNIAIECNGVYWHSGKENQKRHQRKYDLCKNLGIQLIYLWEDEIVHKSDIIEDILASKLGVNNKIYARKCEVKEVASNDCRKFLENNHIQGPVSSSLKYGLYYNGELVQLMTFGKLRKRMNQNHEDDVYELYRFCTKLGYNVIGGASKLLNHFIKNNNPKKIITYCSKDLSNGDIYRKLGFSYVSETKSGFFYIDKEMNRFNRFTLRKDKIDDGSGRTADEILYDNGYFKCFTMGNYKFEINS